MHEAGDNSVDLADAGSAFAFDRARRGSGPVVHVDDLHLLIDLLAEEDVEMLASVMMPVNERLRANPPR